MERQLINKKLLFGLFNKTLNINIEELGKVSKENILNYYHYLTLDLLKTNDKNIIKKYINLFEMLEIKASVFNNDFYSNLFNYYSQVLISYSGLKFDKTYFKSEAFERSFGETLINLGINY